MLTDVTPRNQSSLETPVVSRTAKGAELYKIKPSSRLFEGAEGQTRRLFMHQFKHTHLGQIITYPEEMKSSEVSVVIVKRGI